ncbi:MAG TPA: biotin/lipoyl-containing protein, partial [Geminicoccaceae bacterium]|nr:biotin/lipoyl-containing protein [Geminicoccaceae bacterium]
MSVEIRVPSLGESVTEATVARWFKQVGDAVNADEPIVELETDKVTLEFNAPASGTLAEITVEEGGEVEVGALLGSINEGAGAERPAAARPAAAPEAAGDEAEEAAPDGSDGRGNGPLSPAVRKLLDEHGLDPATIEPSGPKGNLTKGDVLAAIEARPQGGEGPAPAAAERASQTAKPAGEPAAPAASAAAKAQPVAPAARPAAVPTPGRPAAARPAGAREERVKMTRLRRRIAERLKEAQNTAA